MHIYQDLTMLVQGGRMVLCAACGVRLVRAGAARRLKAAGSLDRCESCIEAWAERRKVAAQTPRDWPIVVFTDGGCVGGNPSAVGITWAYRIVVPWSGEPNGLPIRQRAGFIPASRFPIGKSGNPEGTNNHAELEALLQALEGVADGRIIRALWTDSQVTLQRLAGGRLMNVPAWQVERLGVQQNRVAAALQLRRRVLCVGHATIPELVRGRDSRNLPTSVHNSWCDAACSWVAGEVAMGRLDPTVAVALRDEQIAASDVGLPDDAIPPFEDRLIPFNDTAAEIVR